MVERFDAPSPCRHSIEHGFTSLGRSAENGFTLIELLVSLMIFAMLATAGVVMLRGGVDTQAAVRHHLDALADVQRGLATLDADLTQATVRISRTQAGTLAPAFFGRKAQHDAPLFEFVRGGWSNPSGQRHPSLQKVEYWWRDGKLQRVGLPAVDGAAPAEPATLFDHVTDLTLRYRAPGGQWLDLWAPRQPEDLPVALEMVLSRQGAAPLTLRFLVGPAVGQNGNGPPGPGDGNGL